MCILFSCESLLFEDYIIHLQDGYKNFFTMKRILILISLFFALWSTNVFAQAVLKFDKTTHNYGKFTEDKPVSCVFYFTNTGDEPLVIQQVMTSCGCTVAKYTKDPVQPGKKGTINITYNGKGKTAGHFKKVVSVRSNAKNSLVRVYVEGTMTKD